MCLGKSLQPITIYISLIYTKLKDSILGQFILYIYSFDTRIDMGDRNYGNMRPELRTWDLGMGTSGKGRVELQDCGENSLSKILYQHPNLVGLIELDDKQLLPSLEMMYYVFFPPIMQLKRWHILCQNVPCIIPLE